MALGPYEIGDLAGDTKRFSPAFERNIGPIGDVLADWLPAFGTVLEIASGTGQHVLALAERFSALSWLPSDHDTHALASIEGWRGERGLPNVAGPVRLDTTASAWPIECADAILCVNMVHIAPWEATLGLLDGAARLLAPGAPLILYGPWFERGKPAGQGNRDFDAMLRARDPAFGIREVETLDEAARARGFERAERRVMPSDNRMLRLNRSALTPPRPPSR